MRRIAPPNSPPIVDSTDKSASKALVLPSGRYSSRAKSKLGGIPAWLEESSLSVIMAREVSQPEPRRKGAVRSWVSLVWVVPRLSFPSVVKHVSGCVRQVRVQVRLTRIEPQADAEVVFLSGQLGLQPQCLRA